jgi:heptosyltransferase I
MRSDTIRSVRRNQPDRSESRHVCIVLLTGLGDVVHGLPLVNALRDANPGLRITWIAEPVPASLLEGHASIDRVVVYHRGDGVRGVMQLARDLKTIGHVDLTLNLNVYFKSIWPTLLSRARRRIGFDRARAFEGIWLAASEHIPPSPRAHTADMFLEFARHLDVPVPDPAWRIRFSHRELAAQAEFFGRFEGAPVATIIPASASVKKDWITSRWIEVVDSLQGHFGFRVVVAGGPGEREQGIGRDIVNGSSVEVDWAMGDSVRRLAWIIGGSNLVIAPDTGPVHIARALNIPVIGLYGHTNPWRVGPWRAFEDLWVDRYTEPGTEPDPSNRKPKWDRMPEITTSDVLDRVRIAVDKYNVRRRLPRV